MSCQMAVQASLRYGDMLRLSPQAGKALTPPSVQQLFVLSPGVLLLGIDLVGSLFRAAMSKKMEFKSERSRTVQIILVLPTDCAIRGYYPLLCPWCMTFDPHDPLC